MLDNTDLIPADWLVERPDLQSAGEDLASVGLSEESWQELIESLLPGDELWTYCSPADYWQNLAGRAGVACLRAGKVVKAITTIMN